MNGTAPRAARALLLLILLLLGATGRARAQQEDEGFGEKGERAATVAA